jgi:hypothetical protein
MAAAPKQDNKSKKVLRYPQSIIAEQTDYLQMTVIAYKPIGKAMVSKPGDRRNGNEARIRTIILPIPSNISDTNAAKFGDSELNSIGAAVLGGVKDIMESGKDFTGGVKSGMESIGQSITAAVNETTSAIGGLEGAGGFFTRKAASAAVGILGVNVSPEQILARTQGEILNPNLELLFGGPTLRSFRFSFKFIPRNRSEAQEVMEIIRCFKVNMAPKVKGTSIQNTMMKTPNVFELRYKKGQTPHPFLNRFKQCFLETVSVNYTADGTYATYDDGTPVSMTLDLSFKEIEPVYDNDYDEGEGVRGVGY